eukprot:jgi/Chlat1/4059/Chrsp26S04110
MGGGGGAAVSAAGKLVITLRRSFAGRPEATRRILTALGLRGRINQQVERVNNASIRGMLAKIPHMVSVETSEMAAERAAELARQKAPREPIVAWHKP